MIIPDGMSPGIHPWKRDESIISRESKPLTTDGTGEEEVLIEDLKQKQKGS